MYFAVILCIVELWGLLVLCWAFDFVFLVYALFVLLLGFGWGLYVSISVVYFLRFF
jgi:hypothetical protein